MSGMTSIPEDLIRHRSYEIWLRDGCPSGQANRHWHEAKAELKAELCATYLASTDFDSRRMVLPRLKISRLPQRRFSSRIADPSA